MNKSIYTLILIFLVTISVFAQESTKSTTTDTYYSAAEGLTGDELKAALHTIISTGITQLTYSEVWDALKKTDEDPDNSDNVILLYTGWSYPKTDKGGNSDNWNREHTWAKSMGDFGTSKGPGTDIHHLRPTDVTVNSKRGNLMFDDSENGVEYYDTSKYDETSGSSFDSGCSYDSDSWDPRDAVKGDIARMLFYMAVRYESEDGYDLELGESSSSSGIHGKLSTLLEWNEEDPVDTWEENRNEKIYTIQGNRNPFIDHPEYVNEIWGTASTGIIKTEVNTTSVYPNPATEQLNIKTTVTTDVANIKIYGISGVLITSLNNWSISEPINIENLNKGVYFLYMTNDLKNTNVIKFIKN